MSEFGEKAAFIAGMLKLGKVKMVRDNPLYIGKRKRAQMRAGRTRA